MAASAYPARRYIALAGWSREAGENSRKNFDVIRCQISRGLIDAERLLPEKSSRWTRKPYLLPPLRFVRAQPGAHFLDEACGGDVPLRSRLEALLSSHENAGSFLQEPAAPVSPTIDQPPLERLGTHIGPYHLLKKLGDGGMGVVFLAEQQEPVQRQVALKIIRPGMDTRARHRSV